MTNLGALGNHKEPVEVEEAVFDYFGEQIHANPDLSELDYVDFMHIAGGLDPENPVSFGAIKEFARVCIVAEDFDRFWKLSKRNRQDVKDLFDTCSTIVEAVTDRPTGQLSGSVLGPGSTGGTSEDVYFSRAMQLEEGRPDCQLAIIQRRRHLEAV